MKSDPRRPQKRTQCDLPAQIIFNEGTASIDCVVKNLSPWGARLDVDGSVSIPSNFELYIPGYQAIYGAEARWRDPDSVGVEFTKVAHRAQAN